MKLNDLKEHRRLDEKLADWVGNYGAAALKQLGNRMIGDPEGHASIADKHTKERFVNNFLGRAYASLNAEIESGRVDPGLRSTAGASPAAAPTAEPAAPASTASATSAASGAARPAGSAKVAPGDAKAPGYTQRQTNQNINNYVRGMAATLNKETDRNKKIALTKELINFMADRKGYPEWENAVATAKSILQKNQAGGNMIRALQGGQRISEAWNVYWINKLLESVNLTWKDVGLTLLKENKKNGKYIIAETKFYKLNNIFESVLTEAETIGQFMKRWLPTYMRGTDMSDQHTQNLIQKVEDTYPRDKGQEAMKQLATAAYAASYAPGYSAGAAPGGAGAAPGGAGAAPGGAGAAPGGAGGGAVKTSADQLISSIRSGLAKLKALDPATYSKFVKELSGGSSASTTSTAPSTGPAAEPASSTEVPSTVSSPAPKSGLPRPASRPALSGPAAEVGDTSSTGGSTFSSPGVTRHKSAGGREEMQQRARAAADAAKQARAASQRKGLPTTRPVLPNAAAPRLK